MLANLMSSQSQMIFAIIVFLIVYVFIVSEKIQRAIIALVGAAVLGIAGIVSPEQAVEAIDFGTIGLLVGMMIIVGITRSTGIFEYLAIKAAKISKGHPVKIMTALALVTAVLSAFLDNVTTVLLIVPVTFAITNKLEVSPLPYLITEILASNIGGTATLVGDPPNIMIGSAVGHIGFNDFLINLTPVIVLVYVVTIFILKIKYKQQLVTSPEKQQLIMQLDEKSEIKDVGLLKKCLVVLGLTILGFIIHQYVGLESSVIALSGASLLLLLSYGKNDPEHALQAVEWTVIFFFVGLFILVGTLEHLGVIGMLAEKVLYLTGGEPIASAMLILWSSAIASAFIDNIPFVATMIPLIKNMGMGDINLLWWALSLGACLGGNGTIIGASANVVVISMAEKRGQIISFGHFIKVAFPLMLLSIVISTGYLLLWYHFDELNMHYVTTLATLALSAVLWAIMNYLEKVLAKKAN